jgi:hypothetical protein
MRPSLPIVLLSAALVSAAPAWSAAKKSADKVVAVRKPAEKTVTGKLLSVEDSGPGDTYTVETADGKKLQVTADPDLERPEELKDGTQVVLTYAEVSEARVSEVRLAEGPAFKKRPGTTVQGTLVGYQGGDLGGFIVLEQDGKQENYATTSNVLSPEQVTAFTGKRVELSLSRVTARELHDIKPKP